MKHLFRIVICAFIALLTAIPGRLSAQVPSNWIRTIAWSPDGNKIATGSQDGSVQIWNANSGQLLTSLRQGGPSPVVTVAWKPGDSSKLASAEIDQPITIWDTNTGQSLLTIGELPFRSSGIAWSTDGIKVINVNDGDAFQIWDSVTAQMLTNVSSAGQSYSVASSPDGSKIVSGRYDGIEIWTSEGQHLGTLEDNGSEVISLSWNPNSSKIASGNVRGVVHIWDMTNNQVIQTLSGHTDIVFAVAWSPNGTQLATASADHTVRIWNTATGEVISTVQTPDKVFAVAWSPDGTKLAYGNPNGTLTIAPAPEISTPTITATNTSTAKVSTPTAK